MQLEELHKGTVHLLLSNVSVASMVNTLGFDGNGEKQIDLFPEDPLLARSSRKLDELVSTLMCLLGDVIPNWLLHSGSLGYYLQ